MFQQITMIDYARPLAERAASRKVCGPYIWIPTPAPSGGRGFYQSSKGLFMDPRGSTLDLRLEDANDFLRGSRLAQIGGYYCDNFQSDTLQPIIARLPHGRGFLAGWTMGRGMCASLDGYIWESTEEAARAAHDEAERAAERQREFEAEEDARLEAEETEEASG